MFKFFKRIRRAKAFVQNKSKKVNAFKKWIFHDLSKGDYKTAQDKIKEEYKETIGEINKL